jgi:hypothetical protein
MPVCSSTKPDLMIRMLEALDVHDEHRLQRRTTVPPARRPRCVPPDPLTIQITDHTEEKGVVNQMPAKAVVQTVCKFTACQGR